MQLAFQLFGQQKKIDFETYKSWPTITPQEISNDGEYLTYNTNKPSEGDCLTVKALDYSWERELKGVVESKFTEDSRILIFRTLHDSLGILDLNRDTIRYWGNVRSFKIPKTGDGQWLAYWREGSDSKLVIYNLYTQQEVSFENVLNYDFNDEGESLWMQVEKEKDGVISTSLSLLNLDTEKIVVINRGSRNSHFQFDPGGKSLGFLATDSLSTTLRYYTPGMDSAVRVIDLSMIGRVISTQRDFIISKNGDKIFFVSERPKASESSDLAANAAVKIHSYRDELLDYQSDSGLAWSYVKLSDPSHIVQLEKGDNIMRYLGDYRHCDNFLLEERTVDRSNAYSIHFTDKVNLFLIDANDGQRRVIAIALNYADLSVSPTGKYIVWFDLQKGHWFTYNVGNGLTKNITEHVKSLFSEKLRIPNRPFGGPYGLVGWSKGDSAVILQDHYDLWEIDPDSKHAPVNLSHAYGKIHAIELRYLNLNFEDSKAFAMGDTLILAAFNHQTKESGFFRLILEGQGKLERLGMQPRMFYYELFPHESPGTQFPYYPMKAKFADRYIVGRMSATEYPNLYSSRNLSDFQPITNLAPEKQYNWYTTELYHWRLLDGQRAEGVLYRPKNFDAKRKYPIIFFYYGKYADALNAYIHPALSNGVLNIPWYVSNGYLVFVPDIYVKEGHPGESAYNSVVSAALFFSKMNFIDANHMALQGHSYGGYETNYIVSRTSLFEAAASSAAVADLISSYGNSYNYYEQGQGAIGVSLWKGLDLYISNSALFRADKVTTPLLIMHNEGDYRVPYQQGVEWFNVLSRLGKEVWLLSYPGERHVIINGSNQLDYTIRLSQFFNYFLKDTPPPKWMTQGIKPGYELDIENKALWPKR
ncbi:MAG TPA: prolyl oligopeptidase family serine peptidase [Puia sp.]|nr:prolyl oligopeptidase family serine peptidase [Puia sp.]